jgi:pyruvate formate lyase activating enzyme
MIFNIQRFSTHDGEGIRTIIFFKGCPLRCWWCSNPESQSFGYSLMYDQKSCKNFGDCIKQNPAIYKNGSGIIFNREQLQNLAALKETCISKALTVLGEEKTVEELLIEIEKDAVFYGVEGGVTLSGGEPLSQVNIIVSLLHELKKREIDVNIETTLHVNWEKIQRTIGLIDTYLIDLKHIDKYKFKNFTNGNAELVKTNLKNLAECGVKIIIRIPVLPGFNHTEAEISSIINFAAQLPNISEIHFLPYHTLGLKKYEMLGMEDQYGKKKRVENSELIPYVKYAEQKGFQTKIGG